MVRVHGLRMIKAEAGRGYSASYSLRAVALPDDKCPEMREANGDFTLLSIARHALVIVGDLQHLIARILQAQTVGHGAALKRPFAAPSAFGHGNCARHGISPAAALLRSGRRLMSMRASEV
jgi:hypothetical protein